MRLWKRRTGRNWTGWEQFGVGCGLFLVAWLLVFVIFFKFTWGYVVVRPSVHQDLFRMSQLDGIGFFNLESAEWAREWKESWLKRLSEVPQGFSRGDGYYDLQVQSLIAVRRAGFDPPEAPELPKSKVDRVIGAFQDSGIAGREEYFYRRMERLSGLVVAFRANDGEEMYFIAAESGPNGNDQIPYYEVLFDRNLEVFHSQSYTVEWAGIEGSEIPAAAIISGVLLIFLIGGGIILYFCYRLVLTIKDAFS